MQCLIFTDNVVCCEIRKPLNILSLRPVLKRIIKAAIFLALLILFLIAVWFFAVGFPIIYGGALTTHGIMQWFKE